MVDERSLIVPPVDCLVWVRTHGRIRPEKWPGDMPFGAKEGKLVVAFHELRPGEYPMTIAILEQRYPPPKVEGAQP